MNPIWEGVFYMNSAERMENFSKALTRIGVLRAVLKVSAMNKPDPVEQLSHDTVGNAITDLRNVILMLMVVQPEADGGASLIIDAHLFELRDCKLSKENDLFKRALHDVTTAIDACQIQQCTKYPNLDLEFMSTRVDYAPKP